MNEETKDMGENNEEMQNRQNNDSSQETASEDDSSQGIVYTTVKQEATKVEDSEEVPNTLQGDSPEQGSTGPIVGIAIIVILLIVGGIYFWNTVTNKDNSDQLSAIQSEVETNAIVNQLESQGTSDEVTAIEEDLGLTDFENLDSELNNLLNEF